LVFAVFCQSWAQWTESDRDKRGPQGVSRWDRDHVYKHESGYRWPWLSYFSASTQSDLLIYSYYLGGIDYLDYTNDTTNLAAYDKLYAWMHRISNAKLFDMEEGAEWWLYESCDGPTCGPDRSGVEIDQWFDDPQFSTTSMPTSMMSSHWNGNDDYWNDYAYPWHYNYQHLDAADDHWDDSVHHWETISNNYQHWDDNDHYWNMNQNPPAGADPMDTIGNMLGGFIGPELGPIESEMICTSANYMSLAAASEKFPIPQVPLGPSLDLGQLMGGVPGGFGESSRPMGYWSTYGSYWQESSYWNDYGGQMWRTNGDSFNFTFTPAMLDFRKQVLERAFGPDMQNKPLGKRMMEPLVPKLMCAISESTGCQCSERYDFKDQELCNLIQSDQAKYGMEMIGYHGYRDPAYQCMKSLVCGDVDRKMVESGDQTCGFLINGLSFGLFILCAILKF